MDKELLSDVDSGFRETNTERCYWPVRSIAWLTVLIAVSSLSMMVMARGPERQPWTGTIPNPLWRMPQKPVLIPRATPGLPAKAVLRPRSDQFLIEADGEIDPKMVLKAAPNIDPNMVSNPAASARPSLPLAPSVVPMPRGYPVNPAPQSVPGTIGPNRGTPRSRNR